MEAGRDGGFVAGAEVGVGGVAETNETTRHREGR